jgi:hypothetical protein
MKIFKNILVIAIITVAPLFIEAQPIPSGRTKPMAPMRIAYQAQAFIASTPTTLTSTSVK